MQAFVRFDERFLSYIVSISEITETMQRCRIYSVLIPLYQFTKGNVLKKVVTELHESILNWLSSASEVHTLL